METVHEVGFENYPMYCVKQIIRVVGTRKGYVQVGTCLLLLVFSAGCVTANFTKPIASYKASVDTASIAVGTYFTELNNFERDLYLDARVYDPDLTIDKTHNGRPSQLLGGPFKPAAIKARMDSIRLLGAYGDKLAQLAGSKAPQQFSSAAALMGTNLTSLHETFAKLANDPEGGDPTGSKYIGPIAQIAGLLGKWVLEAKRDEMVSDAIGNGRSAVTNIVSLLREDMTQVVVPLRTTGLAAMLSDRLENYNFESNNLGEPIDGVNRRRNMTVDQRKQAIDQIRVVAKQYESLIAFEPTDALDGIVEAHDALLKYAESDRRPRNLAELTAALEAFHEKAQQALSAVQDIRQIHSK